MSKEMERLMQSSVQRGLLLGIFFAVSILLGSCGGGGVDWGAAPTVLSPTIAIENPTSASTYDTNDPDVRLGGTIGNADGVKVINSTTGTGSWEGYVNYSNGQGTWFADVTGLVPGDNVLIATASGGGGMASDAITVRRPLQPALMLLNGADTASATTYWTDTSSLGHQLALFGDGTGRSTTGSTVDAKAGPVVSMNWALDGPETIVIQGCADCSFQRISRISGSVADKKFAGQVETVGGAGYIALDAFILTAGSL